MLGHKYKFLKKSRMCRQSEISHIFNVGEFKYLGLIQMRFVATEKDSSRFLIAVKKKVGSAPQRNRFKRLLREAIRLNQHLLNGGYDICFFISKPPKRPTDFNYLQSKVVEGFKFINNPIKSNDRKN